MSSLKYLSSSSSYSQLYSKAKEILESNRAYAVDSTSLQSYLNKKPSYPFNKNLLTNWYFPEIKVKDNYESIASDSTIIAANDSVNRDAITGWYKNGLAWKIDKYDKGLKFVKVGEGNTSQYQQFMQSIPFKQSELAGKTLTVSMLIDEVDYKNGTGKFYITMTGRNTPYDLGSGSMTASLTDASGYIRFKKQTTFGSTNNPGIYGTTVTMPDEFNSNTVYIKVGMYFQTAASNLAADGAYIKIRAVKLEFGDKQTLAHQDSSGNWVLNEEPVYNDGENQIKALTKIHGITGGSTDGARQATHTYISNSSLNTIPQVAKLSSTDPGVDSVLPSGAIIWVYAEDS